MRIWIALVWGLYLCSLTAWGEDPDLCFKDGLRVGEAQAGVLCRILRGAGPPMAEEEERRGDFACRRAFEKGCFMGYDQGIDEGSRMGEVFVPPCRDLVNLNRKNLRSYYSSINGQCIWGDGGEIKNCLKTVVKKQGPRRSGIYIKNDCTIGIRIRSIDLFWTRGIRNRDEGVHRIDMFIDRDMSYIRVLTVDKLYSDERSDFKYRITWVGDLDGPYDFDLSEGTGLIYSEKTCEHWAGEPGVKIKKCL